MDTIPALGTHTLSIIERALTVGPCLNLHAIRWPKRRSVDKLGADAKTVHGLRQQIVYRDSVVFLRYVSVLLQRDERLLVTILDLYKGNT